MLGCSARPEPLPGQWPDADAVQLLAEVAGSWAAWLPHGRPLDQVRAAIERGRTVADYIRAGRLDLADAGGGSPADTGPRLAALPPGAIGAAEWSAGRVLERAQRQLRAMDQVGAFGPRGRARIAACLQALETALAEARLAFSAAAAGESGEPDDEDEEHEPAELAELAEEARV